MPKLHEPPANWHKITASPESIKVLGDQKKKEIWGILPINPPHLRKKYALHEAELRRQISEMSIPQQRAMRAEGVIDFVVNKTGYKQYDLYCKNCGIRTGTVWAKKDDLIDWCDLHYLSTLTPEGWEGCIAINVSPIDGRIGFECSCGEDTRDYRANKNLPPIAKNFLIEHNENRRPFALPTSAFVALEVGGTRKIGKPVAILKRAIKL